MTKDVKNGIGARAESPAPAPEQERQGDDDGQFAETQSGVVEREADDAIRVGAGGELVVPREDFGADLEEGVELDLAGQLPKKIRKPDRRSGSP